MLRRAIQASIAATIAIASIAVMPVPASAAELPIEVDLVHGFSVKSAEVETGDTVVWHNVESIPHDTFSHTVTADNDLFDSGNLAPGARFSYTFNQPGTFSYKCTLHPQLMMASVKVTGEPVQPPKLDKTVRIVEPGDADSWTYTPNDVTGVVGLKITWRNEGAAPHTVTSEDGKIDSGEIAPGDTWVRTFSKPISMRYLCSLHTWMKGTVRISAEGTTPPPPPPPPPSNNNVGTGNSEDFGTGAPPSNNAGPMTFNVGMVEPSASDIQSWTFAPNTLNARVGDTVVWKNAGAAPHTATAADKSFDSGSLDPGKSFTYKLSSTGSFGYICTLHPWMKGTLVVAAAGTVAVDTPPVAPGSDGSVTTPGTGAGEQASGDGESIGAKDDAPIAPARRNLAIWVLIASVAFTTALGATNQRMRGRSEPPADSDDAAEEAIEVPDTIESLGDVHQPLRV
jgi:plastocyanin